MQTGLLLYIFSLKCRELFELRIKNGRRHSSHLEVGLIWSENGLSFSVGIHCSLTGLSGIMESIPLNGQIVSTLGFPSLACPMTLVEPLQVGDWWRIETKLVQPRESWLIFAQVCRRFRYTLSRSMKQMSRLKLCSLIFFGLSAWIPSCIAYYISFHTPTTFCEPGKESSPSCKVSKVFLANGLVSLDIFWFIGR